MSEQDWVSEVAAALLAGGPRDFSLDEIAAGIGLRVAHPPEIERLFDRLEAAGARVDVSPTSQSLAPLLHRVLSAGRALRAQGQAATPDAIAASLGLSAREVRVALLYGEVLGR